MKIDCFITSVTTRSFKNHKNQFLSYHKAAPLSDVTLSRFERTSKSCLDLCLHRGRALSQCLKVTCFITKKISMNLGEICGEVGCATGNTGWSGPLSGSTNSLACKNFARSRASVEVCRLGMFPDVGLTNERILVGSFLLKYCLLTTLFQKRILLYACPLCI